MVVTAVAIGIVAGCSSGEDHVVTVSAAASLTDVFESLEQAFESEHPEVDVVLDIAGSSTLREHILAGAPVDVFASADLEIMDEVLAAERLAEPATVFARNTMTIVTPAGNPGGVTDLDDLAEDSRLVGLCATGVPCGDYARRVLDRAGVTASVDTMEPNVRALLTKIEAGELDAGIVYVTDAKSGGSAVDVVPIPDDVNVVARYAIAPVEGGPDPAYGARFIAFVLSDRGRSILESFGFSPGPGDGS